MPIKGTYYNATLGAAPTTNGQLGFSKTIMVTTSTTIGSTGTSYNPFVVAGANATGTNIALDPGVYSVVWAYRFKTQSGTPTITSILINNLLTTVQAPFLNNTYGAYANTNTSISTVVGTILIFSGSAIVSTPVTNTLTPELILIYTGGTIQLNSNECYLSATRIA